MEGFMSKRTDSGISITSIIFLVAMYNMFFDSDDNNKENIEKQKTTITEQLHKSKDEVTKEIINIKDQLHKSKDEVIKEVDDIIKSKNEIEVITEDKEKQLKKEIEEAKNKPEKKNNTNETEANK